VAHKQQACISVQVDRSAEVAALDWSPLLNSRAYILATATVSRLHIFSLDPCTGSVHSQAVCMGAVRKPITCILFSKDGMWLYGGSTSGEVITVNAQRAAVQMTHPIMKGGVFVLRYLGSQVGLSLLPHCNDS
jgi:hypothetical protein